MFLYRSKIVSSNYFCQKLHSDLFQTSYVQCSEGNDDCSQKVGGKSFCKRLGLQSKMVEYCACQVSYHGIDRMNHTQCIRIAKGTGM